jgi:hypothetical protein
MSGEEPVDSKVYFGASEQTNIELVRQGVWQRLRKENWNQLSVNDYGFDEFVTFEDNSYRFIFGNLAREVIWELIGLGILVPGQSSSETSHASGSDAWNLPWVQLSTYGQEVVKSGRVVPQDPLRYMNEAKTIGKLCFGDVAEHYLEEALRCFSRSCYTASVLLLGVATEASFLQLCSLYEKSIADPNAQKKFSKLQGIKEKHRRILEKYLALPSAVRQKLPDGLDVTLAGVYDLIRRQRNELGHPQDARPEIDREHAFALFHLFERYLRDIEALAAHVQLQGL